MDAATRWRKFHQPPETRASACFQGIDIAYTLHVTYAARSPRAETGRRSPPATAAIPDYPGHGVVDSGKNRD